VDGKKVRKHERNDDLPYFWLAGTLNFFFIIYTLNTLNP